MDDAKCNRKRKYFRKKSKSRDIESGSSGLLFTCDGSERQAVREVYNLVDEVIEERLKLAEFAATVPDVKESKVNDVYEDISDSVKRFCDRGMESAGTSKRYVRQLPTGVRNCLFFALAENYVKWVYEIANEIYDMAHKSPCCRMIRRVWPIEVTCKVNLTELDKRISNLISTHFLSNNNNTISTYSIEFKTRNNDSLNRTVAHELIEDSMRLLAPKCRTDNTNADVSILFQVFNKTVMLSCIRNFLHRQQMRLFKRKNC